VFEVRPVTPVAAEHGVPDVYWARAGAPLPDDAHVHMCVLTYLSDMGVGEGALASQLDGLQAPSVDHAVWFHRPARLDDWVLFAMQPLSAQGGRLLYTGTMHDAAGRHVATMIQECLLRPIPPGAFDIGAA
jgi:acyl-CoA thioesterase-2